MDGSAGKRPSLKDLYEMNQLEGSVGKDLRNKRDQQNGTQMDAEKRPS